MIKRISWFGLKKCDDGLLELFIIDIVYVGIDFFKGIMHVTNKNQINRKENIIRS